MTNSEFYTRAHNILGDYITHLQKTTETQVFYGGVAAYIGLILVECQSNYIPPKDCLFIIRHHFSYKTFYSSTIKDAFRTFYRAFRELSLDLDPTLSDTIQTRREQGYNTYE